MYLALRTLMVVLLSAFVGYFLRGIAVDRSCTTILIHAAANGSPVEPATSARSTPQAGVVSVDDTTMPHTPDIASLSEVPLRLVDSSIGTSLLAVPEAGASYFFQPGRCLTGQPRSRGATLPVDLVLKTWAGDAFFVPTLLASIVLLWPDYASLLFVLDNEDAAFAVAQGASLPRTRWMVEPLKHALAVRYFGQMWSNLYADRMTTAPVVALLDTDSVLQLRADRASLVSQDGDRLIMRYLRCSNASALDEEPPRFRHWAMQHEVSLGCSYRAGVEYLLGAQYLGNFMVQVPFLVPRSTFAAMRRHVEALHDKPFDDVMAEIAKRYPGKFSQQSAIGNFLLHFGESSGVFAALDGSASVGGLRGVHVLAWGREEMMPHVGRHLGWEWVDGGRYKDPVRRFSFLIEAHAIIRRGVCRSYTDADPALCAAARPPEAPIGKSKIGANDELFWWQEVHDAGPGHARPERYAAATAKSCFTDASIGAK